MTDDFGVGPFPEGVFDKPRRDPADTFVFVDLETTGLRPSRDVILEVGFRVTDRTLATVAETSWVLSCSRHFAKKNLDCDDFVLAMHDKNGLWDECQRSRVTGRDVDELAAEWLYEQGINAADDHPMCGSSVGFDRRFLESYMLNAWAMFGYRVIDVSSIKELAKRALYPLHPEPPMPEPRKLHRVLPDIDDTIEELKYYRENRLAP